MTMNTLPIVFDGRHYKLGGIDYESLDGVVVILDALGVKGIWKTKDPSEVLQSWAQVYYIFSDELSSLQGVQLSAFSDTFIISIPGHTGLIRQPWKFIDIICDSIIPAFVRSMDFDFFFRGVLTMGCFFRSTKTIIGPAVDEAAQYYEKADWVGICLTPSTGLLLANNPVNSNFVIRYDVPQAPDDSYMEWAINWTQSDPNRKYWDILVGKAKKYDNDDIGAKYHNALDFYRACTQM